MAGLLTPTAAQQPQQADPAQPQDASAPPQGNQDASAASLNDPMLKQIEDGIEQAVPPEMKSMYQSIVVAGMNVMFSKETSNLMDQQLAVSDDVVANVSDGIAKLMMIIYNEAKQPADKFVPAAGLASLTLMCQFLDYAEQAKGVKLDETMIADCTKATTQKVLEKFGIKQDQVNQVIAAGQQGGAAQPQQGV